MKILVRSRKDASAVKHASERILGDRLLVVTSLGGKRGENLCKAIRDSVEPFTIVILGRDENIECINNVLGSTPFTVAVKTRTRKPRNSTLEMLASTIAKAKAIMRTETWWDRTFIITRGKGAPLYRIADLYTPETDSFLLWGKGLERLLSYTGYDFKPEANSVGILFKQGQGKHRLYINSRTYTDILLPRDGRQPEPGGDAISGVSVKTWASLEEMLRRNTPLIRLLEEHSLGLLEKTERRKAIVPVSGGKDSTASLLLAVKHFGPENVVAIYVDTGIDFPVNKEYVENITSRLGVELVTVKAGVDSGLTREGLPLPTPENRWCTGRKLAALASTAKRIAGNGKDYALIVGDRDAESPRRGKRGPLTLDILTGLERVAPIKYWSGAWTSLYILSEGLNLNPLYSEGFLRIGCYLCFSLRKSWERRILEEEGFYTRIMRVRPDLKTLISSFLET